MIVFLNDRFINEKEAFIGISDLSVQRGYGIFDYFRTSNKVPLFLDDYLDRFFHSAKQLHLQPLHSREELKKIIYELINKNNLANAGYKMILTGGYSPDGFEPAAPNFIIIPAAVEVTSAEKFDKGLKILLHEYLRDVPTAKSINYLMAIYLQQKLVERNTKDQTVITPDKNVLHGITRKKVLEIAGKKYKAVAKPVTVTELKEAAEVFLTSTTKRLLPVLKIDNVAVGDGKPGKITKELYQSFVELEESYCRDRNAAAKGMILS